MRKVGDMLKVMYAVLGNRSVTEDDLSSTMSIVEQTLNARPLTPVSSDVNDFEASTPITCCVATGTFAYHAQKNLWIIESFSGKLKPMQISFCDRFRKEY